jgi:hypothetical protein
MKNDTTLQHTLDQWAADRPAMHRHAFQLERTTPRKPAPTIQLTNDRTRQTALFDNGGNDLPGQQHLFDDISQEPN